MPWRRRPFRDTELNRALNIGHLREIASRAMPHFAFEYVEGGAKTKPRSAAIAAPSSRYRFIPQTLVNTTARHHRTQLFGSEIKAPLIIAPTGMNGILRRDGDIMLAKAAAAAGIPFCMSTVSTVPIERLATEAGGRLWMQLYVMKNRKVAESIVKRAHAAGLRSAGVHDGRQRIRLSRVGSAQLPQPRPADVSQRSSTCFGIRAGSYDVILSHGMPSFVNFADFLPPGGASAIGGSTIIPTLFAPDITWDDIAWLRGLWDRKLLIKGVLSVSDAETRGVTGMRWGDSHEPRRAAAGLLCRALRNGSGYFCGCREEDDGHRRQRIPPRNRYRARRWRWGPMR